MQLYEMDQRIKELHDRLEAWASDHEGDITDFPYDEYSEQLKVEKDKKLLAIAAWVKGIDAEAEAIKYEEDKLKQRRQALENKSQSLRGLIEKHYTTTSGKLSDARVVLSYRSSTNVIVDHEEKLPDNYFKIERKVDLTKIKQNIDKLSGLARIQKNWNLQIK